MRTTLGVFATAFILALFVQHKLSAFPLMHDATDSSVNRPTEGKLAPFVGKKEFDLKPLFKNERFPNIVVSMNGTLIATWGTSSVRAKRK